MTQATRSNIEIVFADWLDALRRGDYEAMRDRLAADVVHQGVSPELICRNRDTVLAMARRRGALPAIDAVELIAAGDHVVLSVRGPELGPPVESGEPAGHATVVFTLHDGLITKMQDYWQRSDALAAVNAADWR